MHELRDDGYGDFLGGFRADVDADRAAESRPIALLALTPSLGTCAQALALALAAEHAETCQLAAGEKLCEHRLVEIMVARRDDRVIAAAEGPYRGKHVRHIEAVYSARSWKTLW